MFLLLFVDALTTGTVCDVESNAISTIPDEFLLRIRATHKEGREKIEVDYGVPLAYSEPVEIAEMVESHRWAWRPDKPRLILVAESHVFTTVTDLAVRYANPDSARHAPSNYVRLVYCLAYGESDLCSGLKGGTPQYWDIFGRLVGTSPKNVLGSAPGARLRAKVETLQRMRASGIWLLDASLHGIYMPKGERIDAVSGLTRDLQELWWRGYGRALIEDAKPEKIIAIGKGLFNNMRSSIPFDDWIYQPQGARSLVQRQRNAEVLGELADWLQKTGA